MERQTVRSSNVHAVGYDPATKTLEVEFVGGAVYQYRNVPAHVHANVMASQSVGSAVSRDIKGKYEHEKVGDAYQGTGSEGER